MSKRQRHADKRKKMKLGLRPGPDPRPGPGRVNTRIKGTPKKFSQKVLINATNRQTRQPEQREVLAEWKATQVPVLTRRSNERKRQRSRRQARKVNRP